jgi:tetratricopeptide (TPR) repeat protein
LKQDFRSQVQQFKKIETDFQELSKKYELLSQTLSKIQAERNRFEGDLATVTQERDRYRNNWEQETRELQDEIKNLRKESKGLEKQVKKKKDYEGKYKEAVEVVRTLEDENDDLKDDLKEAPKRFKDMAHENKTLIKETAQMHYNLGVFYAEQKKFERAIPEFERAVVLDPREYRAHYNLGYIYSEHFQEHEKAAGHFREYLQLEPQDEGSDWVRSYLMAQETFDGGVLKG